MKVFNTYYTAGYVNSAGVTVTPWNAHPLISIGSGKLTCVAVKTPSEGRVTKVVVKQIGGTSVPFTVELLNSSIPYPAGTAAVTATANDTIDLYRIVAPQSAPAGTTILLADDATGYAYLNADGGPTVNQRYMYLVIIPTGSITTTTWTACITLYNDVG